MTEIIYQPPLIVSFDPTTRIETEFEKYNVGKFVVNLIGEDKVRLYGLLYVSSLDSATIDNVSHSSILSFLEDLHKPFETPELCLGGGLLSFNHPEKILNVTGTSVTFGNVPMGLTEKCLDGLNYKINLRGFYKRFASMSSDEKKVIGWYMDHEFDVAL